MPTGCGTIPPVMSVVVVGSVAFDSVATPFGERERMLGGSATHFSLAASFFTHVRVVGIVGEDFGEEDAEVLTRRGIDTEDLERVAGSTFFWRAKASNWLTIRPPRSIPPSAGSRWSSSRMRSSRT